MMPLTFGEYSATISADNMPDVAVMEGVYLNTNNIFSGMLKWFQLTGVMPFIKSADNMLSLSPQITARQIKPYTYNFNLVSMSMPLKASISDTRAMISIPMFDCVKIGWGKVIFWVTTLIFFAFAAIDALISLVCTIVHCIKHKAPQAFGKLCILNDI